tara:strand:+ start:7151 stop:7663 length:513 start_codon:yes stop_codon:yes gene_type:complete
MAFSSLNSSARWKMAKGFRSGLEERVSEQLAFLGIVDCYETMKISFLQPEKRRTYTPDFILPNGIVVETKGFFTTQDRQKHLWVKEQHPHLDIRFVFTNSRSKIRKGSKTTYADWCTKYGYAYADQSIPVEWIKERKKSHGKAKTGRGVEPGAKRADDKDNGKVRRPVRQ